MKYRNMTKWLQVPGTSNISVINETKLTSKFRSELCFIVAEQVETL